MATWFSFAGIMEILMGNIVFILLFGALAFLAIGYFKFGIKRTMMPIDRSEIERMNFIKRMRMNESVQHFKYFRRGKNLIGKITHFSAVKLNTNPHNTEVIQMLVKPFIIPRLKIVNPIGKILCMQINKEHTSQNLQKRELIASGGIYFDYYFGIYYDKQTEAIQTAWIESDSLMRTNWNLGASRYFAKAQEEATFDPNRAHALAMEEKRIQVEQAKRSGKLTSI